MSEQPLPGQIPPGQDSGPGQKAASGRELVASREPKSKPRVALERAQQALRLVSANLPHLSGLARIARLKVTRRTPVASVAASGLVLVNPDVYATVPLLDGAFVLAHELMHLALDTHGRQGNSDPLLVNFAHDYLINDMLYNESAREPPLGGLFLSGAREKSLEELVADLQKEVGGRKRFCWNPRGGKGKKSSDAGNYPLRRAMQDAGLVPRDQTETLDPGLARGDVIPSDREEEFEPEIDPNTRKRLREQVRREAAKAASLSEMRKKIDAASQPDAAPQRGEAMLRAIRDAYDTPWELALQRWLDAVAPGDRSYLRPSRRRVKQSNVVLPGRRREGWTLHILLDTSGSMTDFLPRALGAISFFAEGAGVAEVHVLQCDEEVTHDDWVDPEDLAEFRVGGFGGSDMAPGINRLAEDPEVLSVLVLTDGYIYYPSAEPPFRVLWVLIGDRYPDFQPPYGDVIEMNLS
jgi:predicted metal-dependent peptidase